MGNKIPLLESERMGCEKTMIIIFPEMIRGL